MEKLRILESRRDILNKTEDYELRIKMEYINQKIEYKSQNGIYRLKQNTICRVKMEGHN